MHKSVKDLTDEIESRNDLQNVKPPTRRGPCKPPNPFNSMSSALGVTNAKNMPNCESSTIDAAIPLNQHGTIGGYFRHLASKVAKEGVAKHHVTPGDSTYVPIEKSEATLRSIPIELYNCTDRNHDGHLATSAGTPIIAAALGLRLN